MIYYSLQTSNKHGVRTIEFQTDDPKLYERVVETINCIIDAARWNAQIKETKFVGFDADDEEE